MWERPECLVRGREGDSTLLSLAGEGLWQKEQGMAGKQTSFGTRKGIWMNHSYHFRYLPRTIIKDKSHKGRRSPETSMYNPVVPFPLTSLRRHPKNCSDTEKISMTPVQGRPGAIRFGRPIFFQKFCVSWSIGLGPHHVASTNSIPLLLVCPCVVATGKM